MAHFNLYFSCLVLMALTWRTSTGLPVRTASADQCAQCSVLFRNLLVNITELLKNEAICYAVTSDKMLIESKSETVQACAPTLNQTSTCMTQKNTSFSEAECFRNIMKDLAHYDAVIQSYLNLAERRSQDEITLLRPTLGIIRSLRQNCSLMPNEETESSEDDVNLWEDNSYEDRKKMCKLMKGFHIRTITINRAMGYISSGDHMK